MVFENAYCGDYDFLSSLAYDLKKEALSPLYIKVDDLLVIIPVTAVTFILVNNDYYIRDKFELNKSGTLDSISNIDILGDGVYGLAGCALLSVIGGKKEKLVTRQIVESFVETGLIVTAIKYLTGRHRPSFGDNLFIGPSISEDSFPSGHTAVAFTVATVVGDAYDCPIITYPIAALVGLSRIYKGAHWASDVFVGATLGILVGKLHKMDYEQMSVNMNLAYENGKTYCAVGCRW